MTISFIAAFLALVYTNEVDFDTVDGSGPAIYETK